MTPIACQPSCLACLTIAQSAKPDKIDNYFHDLYVIVTLMLTITDLLFTFISLAILGCMVVLFALSPDKRHKIGYVILILSFIAWDWFLYSLPRGTVNGWLYLMPLAWLILIFRYGFPITTPHQFPPQTAEPHNTQESLQGASGTREALTFYFLLLMIGSIVLLLFLYMTQLIS